MNSKSLVLVFLGSGLGGCARWCLSIIPGSGLWHSFPWATFCANVLACGLAGFIGSWSASRFESNDVNLFWLVGFCGGFSTMSAFSREWLMLIQSGSSYLLMYPIATLCACLAATYAGVLILNYISS